MKLPSFQFYPGDWLKDTRCLSPAAKGAWIDLIVAMWDAHERGQLEMPLSGYARIFGTTSKVAAALLKELGSFNIFERFDDGKVILIKSRRMIRDEKSRRSNAARQRAKYTRDHGQNGSEPDVNLTPDLTDSSQQPHFHSSSSSSIGSTNGRTSPTLDDVLAAAITAGVPPDVADTFWNEMDSVGWIDARQRPLRNWRTALKAYGNKWRANIAQRRSHSPQHSTERPQARL